MRILFSTVLVVVGLSNLLAQEGISFAKADWGQLLDQSKETEKLLFVDIYADWCGPCKMMDMHVFSQEEVGTFFNEHFISAKFNAEQGEGIVIADQYGVEFLPTFLFVDGNGDLVYKAVGYYEPEQLIQLGERALDPAFQLTTLWANYEEGDRSADLLMRLTEALYESGNDRYQEVAGIYLDTQSDLSTPDNLMFVLNYGDGTGLDLFDFVLEHRSAYEQLIGVGDVQDLLAQMIMVKIGLLETSSGLKGIEDLYKRAFPEMGAQLFAYFLINYYGQANDQEKFAEAAIDYYKAYPAEDWEELNEIAWTFYESVDNPKYLQQAIVWAEQSINLDRNYYNLDTLAALHFKLGNKKAAKKAAKEAIEIAELMGEEALMTKELLEEINKM